MEQQVRVSQHLIQEAQAVYESLYNGIWGGG